MPILFLGRYPKRSGEAFQRNRILFSVLVRRIENIIPHGVQYERPLKYSSTERESLTLFFIKNINPFIFERWSIFFVKYMFFI